MTEPINRDALLYRKCVGIVLFNDEGKVFVGERIDTPGAWQMPQGGVDPGETTEETAIRELAEEVGTDKAEIIHIHERKLRYDLPDDAIRRLWNGKFRGQEQTWVAAKFMGSEQDIDLNAFDPPEFSDWQWIELPKTIDLIVPFKHEIYRNLIEMFSDIDL